VSGAIRPIAFAVLRLITNLNLVGCIMGKCAVAKPAGVDAYLPICVVTSLRFPQSVNAVDEAILDRFIAAGEDD